MNELRDNVLGAAAFIAACALMLAAMAFAGWVGKQ
jgi:hypothetical protein